MMGSRRVGLQALTVLMSLGLLGGCSVMHHGERPTPNTVPDTARPQVAVIDGKYLVVSPEPLLFRLRQGPVRIFWQLPPGSPYTFDAEQGITIDGEIVRDDKLDAARARRDPGASFNVTISPKQDQLRECRVEGKDRKEFSCLNANARPGRFVYTIRVRDGEGKLLPPLDPTVMDIE